MEHILFSKIMLEDVIGGVDIWVFAQFWCMFSEL